MALPLVSRGGSTWESVAQEALARNAELSRQLEEITVRCRRAEAMIEEGTRLAHAQAAARKVGVTAAVARWHMARSRSEPEASARVNSIDPSQLEGQGSVDEGVAGQLQPEGEGSVDEGAGQPEGEGQDSGHAQGQGQGQGCDADLWDVD